MKQGHLRKRLNRRMKNINFKTILYIRGPIKSKYEKF